MKVYTTDKIRNVVFLGHGGTGKTTLAEAMAHLTGVTSRIGNVTDGNTISDFDKEEIKRKFSISTAVVPVEYKGIKINILDTPGYFDFVGEAVEAAGAADAAVIVLNGKSGLQVGAQKAWRLCDDMNLPRMIFLSAMDLEDANYEKCVEDLKEAFGTSIAPLHMPIKEGANLIGYVDIVKQSAKKFGDKGKEEDIAVPAALEDELASLRDALMETAAETSEELMDTYFENGELTEDEIMGAIAQGVAEGTMVPVIIGAPTQLKGVELLMNEIVAYFPNPGQRTLVGKNLKDGSEYAANYNEAGEKTAYIWKTMVDPFIGKYSLIKVGSGILKGEDTLSNAEKGSDERLGKVYVIRGNKPEEVTELHAGDIGALAKLSDGCATGNTLSTKAFPVVFEPTALPVPYTYKAYRTLKKGDEDKVSQSLARLSTEDQTIKNVIDADTHQSLLYGMGEQHLDIVVSKLKERYKVEVELLEPKVAFKETIRGNSDVEGKHKKQSGGHGQYGHVKMRFSPSGDQSKPYEFEQVVVGGTVPKNYFPAVEKGLAEAVQKGPLAAYPVVGVKATLYDGSYHPVDSSEQAFKTATHKAFKDGFLKANPILLEPIVSLKVIVPDRYTGDVMGDLNKRRGRVLGMNPDHKGNTIIEADIPQLELYGYNTQLRSMTGGSGDFSYEFARYEQAPNDIQEKQIQARQEELAEGADED
ncbi:MAG: elongation factor G [Lachnospiraceae bacterium]|nr:elongation factor G [Lachnospiraceae bacterium]